MTHPSVRLTPVPPPQLAAAVASYGAAIAAKFSVGGGEPEDHLRSPFEQLLADVAALAGLGNVVASGEHHLADERIRPDYAVHVGGTLIGFVEIKAPGKGAEPARFKGHDKRQWERLACLPNVLYSDGQSFGLYATASGWARWSASSAMSRRPVGRWLRRRPEAWSA